MSDGSGATSGRGRSRRIVPGADGMPPLPRPDDAPARGAADTPDIPCLDAGVMHDLNHLLAVIQAAAVELAGRAAAGELAADNLARQDLGAIIDASAAGRDMLAPPPRETAAPSLDMDEAIGGLARRLSLAAGPSVRLRLDLHAPGLRIGVSRVALGRVLLNLVINARDAMPDSGDITLRTHASTAMHAVVDVHDTGPGLTADIVARLAEDGFTTKRDGRRGGLGLVTTRALLADCGGFLSIESAVGRGTRARVHFPYAAETAIGAGEGKRADMGPPAPDRCANDAPDPASAMGGEAGARGTVLVIEDDAALGCLTARALGRRGWNVLSAASGEAALAELCETAVPIRAVITDLSLPGMTGPNAVREIRAMLGRSDLPAIVMSGFEAAAASPDRSGELPGAHPVAFLAKPFAMAELAVMLERLAADRHERRSEPRP